MKKFVFTSIASVITFGLACSAIAAMAVKNPNKPLQSNEVPEMPINKVNKIKTELTNPKVAGKKQVVNKLPLQKVNQPININ